MAEGTAAMASGGDTKGDASIAQVLADLDPGYHHLDFGIDSQLNLNHLSGLGADLPASPLAWE
jgi:hypothetical protein